MRNSYKHGRGYLALVFLMLLAGYTVPATAITVNGDLTDLITASAGVNGVSGVDVDMPTGELNGFDINNMYAYYDSGSDTFFMGFDVIGTIGTAGGSEDGFGFIGCNAGQPGGLDGNSGVFDGCEKYGIGIDIGSDDAMNLDFQLKIGGDAVADSGNGTENVSTLVNPSAASFDYVVAETTANGIEFSVTGLDPSPFPRSVTYYFYGETVNNTGIEDIGSLTTTVVPVPAAVWLFGSGLLGLVGVARRRERQ